MNNSLISYEAARERHLRELGFHRVAARAHRNTADVERGVVGRHHREVERIGLRVALRGLHLLVQAFLAVVRADRHGDRAGPAVGELAARGDFRRLLLDLDQPVLERVAGVAAR